MIVLLCVQTPKDSFKTVRVVCVVWNLRAHQSLFSTSPFNLRNLLIPRRCPPLTPSLLMYNAYAFFRFEFTYPLPFPLSSSTPLFYYTYQTQTQTHPAHQTNPFIPNQRPTNKGLLFSDMSRDGGKSRSDVSCILYQLHIDLSQTLSEGKQEKNIPIRVINLKVLA